MNRNRKICAMSYRMLALATAVLVFAEPGLCADSLRQGLALCGGPLLVSLYPFLLVSSLLACSGAGETLGVVFRPVARGIGLRGTDAKSAGGVLLMGFVGGFAPAASAASAAVHSGRLSARAAEALLPACICSGPSFVILTVGGQLLGSRALGVQLFASQVAAGWLSAALLNRVSRDSGHAGAQKSPQETMPLPGLDVLVAQAAVTYLKLCGFILYFRLLAAGVSRFLPGAWAALPAMLLEVCSGCDCASRTGVWASSLCCAALSVQGASVLLQVRTLCPPQVSLRRLLAARTVHLPLSLALFWLGLPRQAAETFSTLPQQVILMRRVPADCALAAFFLCCLTAWELCRAADHFR